MARATNPLFGSLIDPLVPCFCGDSQDLLLLGSLQTIIIAFLGLALLAGGLLLGVTWALLATLMLTLDADLFGSKRGTAVVTLTVNAHANGLLNALDADGLGRGSQPLVGLEGQAIFGEEKTSTLLLKSTAIDLVDSDGRRRRNGSGRDGGFGSRSSSVGSGIIGSGTRRCMLVSWRN